MSIKKIVDKKEYIKDDACRVKLFHTKKGWMSSAKHSLELGMIGGAALMGGLFTTHITSANADSAQNINVTVPHSNVDQAVSNAQSQKVTVATGTATKQSDGTYKYSTSTTTKNAINVSKDADKQQTVNANQASSAENSITNDYNDQTNKINSATDSAKKAAQDFENKQNQINQANQSAVNNYNATKTATDKNNATLKNDVAQAQKDGVQVTQNSTKDVSSQDQANQDFSNNDKAIKDADAKQQQYNKDYQDAVNKNNSDKAAADSANDKLNSTIDAAKAAGIKVTDGGSKDVNSIDDLQKDYSSQEQAIQNLIDSYKAAADEANKKNQQIKADNDKANSDYQAAMDKYNKDLADYQKKEQEYEQQKSNYDKAVQGLDETGVAVSGIDPSSITQKLILNKCPNATVKVLSSSSDVTVTVQNPYDDSKAPKGVDSKELVMVDAKNGFKGVNGDVITVEYDGDFGSYNGTEITKEVRTFKNLKAFVNPDADKLYLSPTETFSAAHLNIYSDPTDGFWYNGSAGVTTATKYYDKNGNEISFDPNLAYLTIESLNHHGSAIDKTKDGSIEGAKLLSSGKADQIKGSSVTVHNGNYLYSDKNNDQNAKNWDVTGSLQEYYGAGLFQVGGNEIDIEWTCQDPKEGYSSVVWAQDSTTIPFIPSVINPPQKPQEPQKPTLQNEVPNPVAGSITVHHDNLKQDTPQLQHVSVSYNLDQPADLVLQKNDTFSPSNVSYHYDNLDVTPTVNKDVDAGIVQGKADSINGQNVVAGQSITFPLIQQDLPANRTDKYTSYEIIDKLDKNFDYESFQSFLDSSKSQEDTSDWTPSLTKNDDGTYTLTLKANQSLLNAMNADMSKSFSFPIEDLYGKAINDGQAINNTYQVIANATDESGKTKGIINATYTSNTVTVYTTDAEKPTKSVDNENGQDINNKVILPGDVLDYNISFDLDGLKNIAITPDTIAKKLGIEDKIPSGATVQGISVKDANGNDITSLFDITHNGNDYTINVKDPLSFIKEYGDTKPSVEFKTKVNNDFSGDLTNIAVQNTFGNLTKTNVVVNHVNKIDPKKDICINVGDEASLNGKDLQLGKTYNYVLDVDRPANYGGVTKQMDIVDHLPKQADFTGDVEIFSKGPITLADGEVLPKGDNITKFFNISYDASTNTVKASPNAELIKALNLPANDANEIGWKAYIQFIAKGYGEYVNTFEEIYNGDVVKSNTVKNNVPEPKKEKTQVVTAPKAKAYKVTPANKAVAPQIGSSMPSQQPTAVATPQIIQQKNQPAPAVNKQVGSAELPQTGDNSKAMAELAAAGLIGMLGMASLRKKKED